MVLGVECVVLVCVCVGVGWVGFVELVCVIDCVCIGVFRSFCCFVGWVVSVVGECCVVWLLVVGVCFVGYDL